MARLSLVVMLCAAACSSARAAAPERAAVPERAARVDGASAPAATKERSLLLVANPPARERTKDNVARLAAGNFAAAGAQPDLASTSPAAGKGRSACPDEMALVERPQGRFCIDRWEAILVDSAHPERRWPGNQRVPSKRHGLAAKSVPGAKPQAYVSGAEAARACENSGKRLCALDEWVRACRGPRGLTYPYGDRKEAGRCNDRFGARTDHPVVALFDRLSSQKEAEGSAPAQRDRSLMWGQAFMNDARLYDMPNGVEPAGAHPECRSEYGAYDMVGNLHEWVDDPDGTFAGGFFMDTTQNGEGCGYRTRAHDFDYHDYSTGFRCCKDAASS